MSNLVGATLLNRYHIESFVGRGGMAEVYKVWDAQRATYLAMKLLREDLAQDRVFLRRFKREAETLARLQHPSIVRFYGLEQDGPVAFMLMDYIEGTSLRREIFDSGGAPLLDKRVREVLRPICSALHYAHSQGMIHCDIKPGNILIDQTGRVLVSDFGIARMTDGATATMVGMGTPAYMAPEQVLGQEPLPQTDIYALGVVLYEMLTGGERPFTGERAKTTGSTSEKVRWEQLKLKPPPLRKHNPDISPEVEAVVLQCLAKEPEQRYPAPLDLLNALERAMGEAEIAAPLEVAEAPVRLPELNQQEAVAVEEAQQVVPVEPPQISLQQPVESGSSLVSVPGKARRKSRKASEQNQPKSRPSHPAARSLWTGGIFLLVAGVVIGLLALLGIFGDGNKIVDSSKQTATLNGGKQTEVLDSGRQGTGLLAEYYDNADLTNPQLSRVDPKIDFHWGEDQPDPRIGADTFSVVWMGQVQPPTTGTYTFNIVSDDGVRLWVDGQLLIDAWYDQGGEEHIGTIDLDADKLYDIRLEYYDATGEASIQLRWSEPGKLIHVVPQSQLYPTYVITANPNPLPQELVLGGGSMQDIAVSPSGTKAAVVGSRGGWLYDLPDLNRPTLLAGSQTSRLQLMSVAFSPDGQMVAGGGCPWTQMFLWNAHTGEEISRSESSGWCLLDMAFSPDKQTLIAASDDNYLRLYEVSTLNEIRYFEGHTGPVRTVAFSPDGQTILSGSEDGTARLWDTGTGQEIASFTVDEGYLAQSVAFSPDGSTVAIGAGNWSWDRPGIVWLRNGTTLGLLRRLELEEWNPVRSVAFLPDGKSLLAGVWNPRLINAQTGEYIRSFDSSWYTPQVALVPGGPLIVTSSEDGTVRVWNINDGSEVARVEDHTAPIMDADISPDGQTILAAEGDRTFRLWNAMTGQEINRIDTGSYVNSVAFSPDAKSGLVGTDESPFLRLWNLETGEQIGLFEGHTEGVTSVAFSPNGLHALSGSYDDTVRLWDVRNRQELMRFEGHTEDVTSVAFSPDGRFALSGSRDDTARMWDISTGQRVYRFEHNDDVMSVAFSPDDQLILTGAHDGARLWDTSSGARVKRSDWADGDWIDAVAFSPDGHYIVTSRGETIMLWDAETGEFIRAYVGHSDGATSLVFSPDGSRIISTSWDGTVRVWEFGDLTRQQ